MSSVQSSKLAGFLNHFFTFNIIILEDFTVSCSLHPQHGNSAVVEATPLNDLETRANLMWMVIPKRKYFKLWSTVRVWDAWKGKPRKLKATDILKSVSNPLQYDAKRFYLFTIEASLWHEWCKRLAQRF